MHCKHCGRGPGGTIQINERGAIQLTGLGRFPLTLYKDQWLHVFSQEETIKKLIADNPQLPTRAERDQKRKDR